MPTRTDLNGLIKSSQSTLCQPAPAIRSILEELRRSGNPLDRLTPEAVRKLRAEREAAAGSVLREIPVQTVRNLDIPVGDHPVPVKVYIPWDRHLARNGKLPMLIYVHGGGWTLGSPITYDSITRELARRIPALVVSVDYRLAPEHPFPAGFDDVYGVVSWLSQHTAELGGDPSRLAIAGDSAGGNLAAAVLLRAKSQRWKPLRFQVLFYPCTNLSDTSTESYRQNGRDYLLTKTSIESFRRFYVPNPKEWFNPYVSPLLASDYRGLPPALIVTAGCDPLRDEGKAYADRLHHDGIEVHYRLEREMIHGFLNFFNHDPRVSPLAEETLDEAASVLRKALD